MTHHFTRMAAFAIALSVASPLVAQDTPDADTVVATVDGKDITLGHMILTRQALPPQYGQLPPEVLFKGILDQLVQQSALADAYEGDAPRRVRLAMENEERSLIAAEEVGKVLENGVTDAAIEQAYKDTYASAEAETEYKAAHILVETEDEAKALVTELEGGADFATLAKEKSTGPSGPNGGDLGWFGKGMMVPEFENAVVDMESGAISAPVQTQFGWHVIKLEETRVKEAPTLDEVRDELRAKVEQDVVKAHIDALVENANVDTSGSEGIDPALLMNLDLLE
ncbi:peptidylprolyl isomerase [Pseudooceanicola onchidii]|uniref:peptidylprolyl isomerase n=1 Tax=Pseudooceanicola onchidii TaxID=2562279 RepID=UPI0010AB44C1|nr:peptidylprolyl isomerase [Pseudooceanicola onchidii]